jgi:phage host-nuclease inhibitor protein Gam
MRKLREKMQADKDREVSRLQNEVKELQAKMSGEYQKEISKLKQENSSLN